MTRTPGRRRLPAATAALAFLATIALAGPMITPVAADDSAPAPATSAEASLPLITLAREAHDSVFAVGARGYGYDPEGPLPRQWLSYDGTVLGDMRGATAEAVSFPDGTERLFRFTGDTYDAYDEATGEWTPLDLPAYYSLRGIFGTADGPLVLAQSKDSGTPTFSLRTHLAGQERVVSGWPAQGLAERSEYGDANGVLLRYQIGVTHYLGLVDFSTHALVWSKQVAGTQPVLPLLFNSTHFGWYENGTAYLLPRSNPTSEPLAITLPQIGGLHRAVLAGNWLLVNRFYTIATDAVGRPERARPVRAHRGVHLDAACGAC